MSDEPGRALRDDRVGTMFGVYRIDSLIGVGGMGKVYRATVGDDLQVALKVVKEDLRETRPSGVVSGERLGSPRACAIPTWSR